MSWEFGTRSSNFDEKFGPTPVHLFDEMHVLLVQALVVFLISVSIQPSFLQRPNTDDVSLVLSFLFSMLVVVATVVVHRSFILAA